MQRSVLIGCVVAATVIAVPGVARGQNRERQQIMGDIRMLHEQTMRLQQLISDLSESLDRLSGELDRQADATVRALADQRLLVDGVAATATPSCT